MNPRVYIDTSVVGGCFDEEFAFWSLMLFDEFRVGVKQPLSQISLAVNWRVRQRI